MYIKVWVVHLADFSSYFIVGRGGDKTGHVAFLSL